MITNLLSRHHEDLDRRIASLLTRADGGDTHDLAQEWSRFEADLLRHFEIEERSLLPRFAQDQPEEAAALRLEHAALRRDLLALGIRADLHFLRAEAVRDFVADLHAHATREERSLYPWAKEHVAHGTWAEISEGLRDAGHAVARALSDLGSQTL
jgi:hemerythrin superfamily protein